MRPCLLLSFLIALKLLVLRLVKLCLGLIVYLNLSKVWVILLNLLNVLFLKSEFFIMSRFRSAYSEPVGSPISFVDSPSRTKQAHAGECDINFIMNQYLKTGVYKANPLPATYDEFEHFDFHSSMNKILEAQEVFSSLPALVRKEFNNDPASFLTAFSDPSKHDFLRNNGLLPPLPDPVPDPAPAPVPAPDPVPIS